MGRAPGKAGDLGPSDGTKETWDTVTSPRLCPDGCGSGLFSSIRPPPSMDRFSNDNSNSILLSQTLPWLSVALRPKLTAFPTAQRTQRGPASQASPSSSSIQPGCCVLSLLRAFAPAVPSGWNSLPVSALGSQFRETLLTFWLLLSAPPLCDPCPSRDVLV